MADEERVPLISKINSDEVKKDNEEEPIAWKYFIILPIVSLSFISFGLESYTSTQWIQYFLKVQTFLGSENGTAVDGCNTENHSDPNYIAYQQVQTDSAAWQLYKNLAMCIPAFCVTLALPSYSDSLGRRFLFIIGTTGCLLQSLVQASVVYLEVDLYYFIIGAPLGGIFGGVYSISSASLSYIADITKSGRKRTFAYSAFDCYILACITVSGLACGYIITYAGYFVPFAASSVMLSIALVLAILFLPETHEKKNRVKPKNVCQTLNRTIEFYKSSTFRGHRAAYSLLLVSFFFQEITSTHRSSIEMIFQLGMPLCWTADKVGVFSALRHAAQALSGAVLIVPLKAWFSELTIAIWSTLFNAGSFVMEAFAQTDLIMYLVSVPATLSFLTVPMIKSIMSMMTPADKQGSLFAGVAAIQSICGIVANFVLNSTYAATVSFMNGFVFILMAGLSIIVFVLLCVFGLTQKTVYQTTIMEKRIKV